MGRNKKGILAGISLVLGIILLTTPWAGYVAHLARHQVGSLILRQKISDVSPQSPAEKEQFAVIQKAKEFGMKLYGLSDSKSYEYYVDLKRKSLGWNLTVAPALEMRAREFYFPFAGKFGYLGFFDEALKDRWKVRFTKDNFDVYENEIGAYSTLGYFKDPIFSTYLEFDGTQLASLILHEMVHERLYLKNDSDFSESMASFMERVALNLYLYRQIEAPPQAIARHKKFIARYNAFQDLLDGTRENLEKLYAADLKDSEKLARKNIELKNLRKRLTQPPFQDFPYATRVAEMPDLNNAFLVQNSRYTPSHRNGFSVLLKDCKEDIACWFAGLEKLESCGRDVRRNFAATEIRLEAALQQCQ